MISDLEYSCLIGNKLLNRLKRKRNFNRLKRVKWTNLPGYKINDYAKKDSNSNRFQWRINHNNQYQFSINNSPLFYHFYNGEKQKSTTWLTSW